MGVGESRAVWDIVNLRRLLRVEVFAAESWSHEGKSYSFITSGAASGDVGNFLPVVATIF